jgi:hypothetical protein
MPELPNSPKTPISFSFSKPKITIPKFSHSSRKLFISDKTKERKRITLSLPNLQDRAPNKIDSFFVDKSENSSNSRGFEKRSFEIEGFAQCTTKGSNGTSPDSILNDTHEPKVAYTMESCEEVNGSKFFESE